MSRVFIIIECWTTSSFTLYKTSVLEAVAFSVSNKVQAAGRYITNKRISYFCVMFSTLIKVKILLYILENCERLYDRIVVF